MDGTFKAQLTNLHFQQRAQASIAQHHDAQVRKLRLQQGHCLQQHGVAFLRLKTCGHQQHAITLVKTSAALQIRRHGGGALKS